MRILRKGGEFADRQMRRTGKTALWYFIGFAAICAVFFLVSYEVVALLGLVLAFKYFTTAFDKWEHWFLGHRGELAVTRALSALPDGYVLLNDLMLPDGKGNVDHFLIGPNGLFVIETKNYDGDVSCDGDRWFINGKQGKSLSRQVKGNALAVKKALDPLFAQHRMRCPYIEPVLVFVKHKRRLELKESTVQVLKAEELVDFIHHYEKRSRFPRFSPDLTRAIVHHIHDAQSHALPSTKTAKEPSRQATAAHR